MGLWYDDLLFSEVVMGNNILGVVSNISFVSGFIAWLCAQFLKVPIYALVKKKFVWSRMLSSGGMPSSHTATCVAIATSIGMTQGFYSPMFTIAAGLAAIVMYDATGVRRAAGDHARILNELVETMQDPDTFTDDRLKEWIGHTPFEVTVGALLGIMIAYLVTRAMLG